ncbi:hypothetical protein EMIHUDRAFT_459699, partial [Emiliania huxleyi CCMP1516]|uniref:Diphthine--ammonia ligase n=2 Tax=Emiliania huxleyi TaxID=2903 RepID=A0A0D3ILU4_EMIH1
MRIAMANRRRVLTVGDGDMSCSLALARAFGDRLHLLGSTLCSHVELERTYAGAAAISAELSERGARVAHGVDATALEAATLGSSQDHVVFCHPHLGLSDLLSVEEHARRHIALIGHFLASAKSLLAPGGLIHLTLCGNQRASWRVDDHCRRLGLEIVDGRHVAAPPLGGRAGVPVPPQPEWRARKRFRDGSLGSRHALAAYGYEHRRTEGGSGGERCGQGDGDVRSDKSVELVIAEATPTPCAGPRRREDQAAECCAVSWTGGKDCNLALLAAWRDASLRVAALVVFRPEGAVFRAHPLCLMEAQAASLGLPLLHEAYVRGIRRLREQHGVRVLATGDMDLVGTMARNWIEECAEAAGVRAFLPLWQAERASLLRRLLAERFLVFFSCVKSPWFEAGWVGRQLDAAAVYELETLAAQPEAPAAAGEQVKPLDLGGERGEYHTMCLDGPLYGRRVAVTLTQPLELQSQPGQREGERWWTLGFAEGSVEAGCAAAADAAAATGEAPVSTPPDADADTGLEASAAVQTLRVYPAPTAEKAESILQGGFRFPSVEESVARGLKA